jgi:hypothetical protein
MPFGLDQRTNLNIGKFVRLILCCAAGTGSVLVINKNRTFGKTI